MNAQCSSQDDGFVLIVGELYVLLACNSEFMWWPQCLFDKSDGPMIGQLSGLAKVEFLCRVDSRFGNLVLRDCELADADWVANKKDWYWKNCSIAKN